MSRIFLALALAFSGLSLLVGTAASAATATHSIAASGTGVGMYPAFDPGIERYGLTTTTGTGGSVQVTATTTDPDGTVLVNGIPATGPTMVEGLEDGDEISVIFVDTDGTTVNSLVYLPSGFPTLETVVDEPGAAPGMVGLTLSQWSDFKFETVIDGNGVPVWVSAYRQPGNPLDVKRQPNGHYSVSRPTTTPGRSGEMLVELDEAFEPVATHETQGLVNTDGHDSVLLPDGSKILIAYEPSSVTDPESGVNLLDSVIQEFDPAGKLVFEWNSADHINIPAETTMEDLSAGYIKGDYAHINSVQLMEDGHLLASFRHLSAVLKIARFEDGPYVAGDVIWRLGGKISDFEFVDDPFASGPCAQHTGYEVASGNIVIFDNGSGFLAENHCVDPADPGGPSIARPITRITEYQLDEVTGTATLVWDYAVEGRYSFFAGSAQRLDNGNTLVGWAPARDAVATEVGPDKTVLWEIRDSNPTRTERFFSYRALKFDVPDAIQPEVSLTLPGDAAYLEGASARAEYRCTDRGGSNLQSCEVDGLGGAIDTSNPGQHTITVTAEDGAGNVTTRSQDYTVRARTHQPDGMVRADASGWIGRDVHGGWGDQRVIMKLLPHDRTKVAKVRLQNDGNVTDRIRVKGQSRSSDFKVRYVFKSRNVTDRVVAGKWRTPTLVPGDKVTLKMRVTRTRSADRGDKRRFVVRATSIADRTLDKVAVIAKARR